MTSADLNPEQRQAVAAVEGPVLVYAGPGTGKTRVVTRRIANQVASGVTAPASILAVTFTEKAAAEMLARLRGLGVAAGGRGGVRAATFHSAALRQVRWFWPQVTGRDAPEVLASKLRVLVPLLRRSRAVPGAVTAADLAAEIEWVKAHGAGVDPSRHEDAPHLASLDLSEDYPRWRLDRDAYRHSLDRREGPWPADLDRDAATDLFAALFDRYEDTKGRSTRVDFEDMLAVAAALLHEEPEVAERVRGHYTHFTVDEFQDVNRLQWDLLTAWLGDRDDVCIVGDDDQAIYGFSGADPRYLGVFRRRYPNATVIDLVRNYRSTQPILDVAAAALWKPQSARKRLRAVRGGDGQRPVLVERSDEQAERDWVLSRCRRLREAGIDWQEMAILYRFNAQSESWEEALAEAGIPYVVRGDQAFFERRHVQRAMQVLRRAQRSGEADPPDDDPLVELDGVEPTRPSLSRLVRRVLRQRMSWTEDPPEGSHARDRWADLGILVELADELAEEDAAVTLQDYLDDLDRRAGLGRAPDGGGVNLLTLHRAKGLEFDAVFVVSCEEGRVPSRYAADSEDGVSREIAEENRLLYVGLTRARTHLHVSWVRRGAKRPSRFLYGLPGGPRRSRPAAETVRRRADDDATPLSPSGEKVFEALREWRLERAMTDGVPAYVVFPDSTLRGIARQLPDTRAELFAISGVGRKKLKRYGEPVLDLVARMRPEREGAER